MKSKPAPTRPRGTPKRTPRNRQTIDHEQRSRHAEKLLAKQMAYRAVSEELMKRFKVCQRTAFSDIALAYERIRASDDGERPHRKLVMRSTWKAQYEACMKAGELHAANRALIELGRLDGLYDPKRIELSGGVAMPRNDVEWDGVPLEDRRRLLAAMDEVDKIAKQQLSKRQENAPDPDGPRPA